MGIWVMNLTKEALLASFIVAAFAGNASAENSETGLTLGAFGTVSAVHTNTNKSEAQFTSSPYLQHAGASNSGWDGTVDTKIGAQATYRLNSTFSGTVQIISKKGPDNTFFPTTEWAYLKIEPTNKLAIRIGRIRVPVFLISDSLDVGYSQHWLRPPVEVYGPVPISRTTGIDLVYKMNVGDAMFTVQPVIGQSTFKIKGSPTTGGKAENAKALNATLEFENFTFRAGYLDGKLTLPTETDGDNEVAAAIDSLNAGFAPFLTPAQQAAYTQLANSARARKVKVSFTGVGAIYDNGSLLVQSEYTRRKGTEGFPDATAWYVSSGYRFGKWMPYATYAKLRTTSSMYYTDSLNTIISNTPVPMVGSPGVSDLMTALRQSDFSDQHTISLGVRYDVMKHVDIKAQFDHVTTGGPAGSNKGLFANTSSGFRAEKNNVNVLSIAVDFAF